MLHIEYFSYDSFDHTSLVVFIFIFGLFSCIHSINDWVGYGIFWKDYFCVAKYCEFSLGILTILYCILYFSNPDAEENRVILVFICIVLQQHIIIKLTVLDGTRGLLKSVEKVALGLIPFMGLSFIVIYGLTYGFMAIRQTDEAALSFMLMYRLFLGDFEDNDKYEHWCEIMLFYLGSIIGTIILLNLLISILSDLYESNMLTLRDNDIRMRYFLAFNAIHFLKPFRWCVSVIKK